MVDGRGRSPAMSGAALPDPARGLCRKGSARDLIGPPLCRGLRLCQRLPACVAVVSLLCRRLGSSEISGQIFARCDTVGVLGASAGAVVVLLLPDPTSCRRPAAVRSRPPRLELCRHICPPCCACLSVAVCGPLWRPPDLFPRNCAGVIVCGPCEASARVCVRLCAVSALIQPGGSLSGSRLPGVLCRRRGVLSPPRGCLCVRQSGTGCTSAKKHNARETARKNRKKQEKSGIARNSSESAGIVRRSSAGPRGGPHFFKRYSRGLSNAAADLTQGGATRASDAPLWASLCLSCRSPAVLPPSASSRSVRVLACPARSLCGVSVCYRLREILPRPVRIHSAAVLNCLGRSAGGLCVADPPSPARIGYAGKEKPGRCALISSGVPLPALDALQASQGASPRVPVRLRLFVLLAPRKPAGGLSAAPPPSSVVLCPLPCRGSCYNAAKIVI